MIHVECPWCAEPATVDALLPEFSCATCRIVVEVAPDPIAERLERAA